jgi:hypothetical protein
MSTMKLLESGSACFYPYTTPDGFHLGREERNGGKSIRVSGAGAKLKATQ